MFSSNDLALLREAVHLHLPDTLAEPQRALLIRLGAVAAIEQLLQTGDPATAHSAAAALVETAAQMNEPPVRELAFAALLRQSEAGQIAAIDALYILAIEHDSLPARQAILSRGWQPSHADLGALLRWQTETLPAEDLPLLSEAYFHRASTQLQQRMQREARARGLEAWAAIVSALQTASPLALQRLIERFPDLPNIERQVLLDGLSERAGSGVRAAQEALALLSVTHEEPTARQLAIERGYAQEDPEQRAVFLFLASDWQRYEELDFNNHLLINAYEHARRTLRRRILDHSRYTGHIEWLRGLHGSSEPRWLEDLSDADWELTIERLDRDQRQADLWLLAQAAPPVWSAAILAQLGERGWQPDDQENRAGFASLLPLARSARSQPLELRPRAHDHAPRGSLTALALAEPARILAAGSSENDLLLWKLENGAPPPGPVLLPGSQVRAIAILPDASLVAAASGDHRIRIFRLPNGVPVKTLAGNQALIREIVLHPAGHTLYSAGFDGTVRAWRFPTGEVLKTIPVGAGEQFALRVSGDGTRLFSGGADGVLRIWSLPDLALAQEIPAHQGMLTQIAASSSGDLVATGGSDGFLRVWNAASGRMVRAITSLNPLTALALHPNENVLASGDKTGAVALWNISTGRLLGTYTDQSAPVTALVFAQQGARLYSSAGSTAAVCDLSTFLALRNLAGYHNPLPAANAAARSAERAWVAFAGALARWRQRYDIELGEPVALSTGDFDIEL